MTFSLAVAAGSTAADDLERRCRTGRLPSSVAVVRHRDLVVAYAHASRWVSTFDDGDVLVVLDGRIHQPRWSLERAAGELGDRYRAHGGHFASGLLGDYVMAVLDRPRNLLLVARDPVGVRPWFRSSRGHNHAGSSDVATLASTHWVDTSINEGVVIRRLAAMTGEVRETVYRGIESLEPGVTWQIADTGTRALNHHRWSITLDMHTTWEAACETARVALDAAVADRLAPHELPTCELSGGLDSSSVVGTVARMRGDELAVGRLLFDTPRADERLYSDAVIEKWGIEAISTKPAIPSGAEIHELTVQLRRPVPDPHFTMFMSIHDALGKVGRPLSVTGAGGDDAFAACSIGSRVVSSLQLRQRRELQQLGGALLRQPALTWHEVVRPTAYYLAPWKHGRPPAWLSSTALHDGNIDDRLATKPARVTGIAAIDERLDNITSGYVADVFDEDALVADLSGRRGTHPYRDPRFVEATYGWNPWWTARPEHPRLLEATAYADRLPRLVAERRSKVEFSEVFWPQVLDDDVLRAIRTGPLVGLGWLDLDGFDDLVDDARKGTARVAIPLSRCRSIDAWLRALG